MASPVIVIVGVTLIPLATSGETKAPAVLVDKTTSSEPTFPTSVAPVITASVFPS